MTKPPWDDNKRMIRWVNQKLDALRDEALMQDTTIEDRQKEYFEKTKGMTAKESYAAVIKPAAIEEARRYGNVTALRKMYPELADFLQPPQLSRGKHFEQFSKLGLDPVAEAVADVERIRDLWKKNYKKVNRDSRHLVSAEEIAAKRWGIRVAEIITRKSNTNRKKRTK